MRISISHVVETAKMTRCPAFHVPSDNSGDPLPLRWIRLRCGEALGGGDYLESHDDGSYTVEIA